MSDPVTPRSRPSKRGLGTRANVILHGAVRGKNEIFCRMRKGLPEEKYCTENFLSDGKEAGTRNQMLHVNVIITPEPTKITHSPTRQVFWGCIG
jgi:hypothetical protein